LCSTFDGAFHWVADVDGLRVVGVHEGDQAVDKVRDVLERAGLRTVSVNLKILQEISLKVTPYYSYYLIFEINYLLENRIEIEVLSHYNNGIFIRLWYLVSTVMGSF